MSDSSPESHESREAHDIDIIAMNLTEAMVNFLNARDALDIAIRALIPYALHAAEDPNFHAYREIVQIAREQRNKPFRLA